MVMSQQLTPLVTVIRGGSSSSGWATASARSAPWLGAVAPAYDGYAEWSDQPVVRREVAVHRVVLIIGLGGPLSVSDASGRVRSIGSFVAGLSLAPTLTSHPGRQRGVEIRLTPPGAYRLFGLPMSELTDRVVDLDAVWGRAAARLVDRLAEAPGWAARFALIDDELSRRVERGPRPDPELENAWRRLERSSGNVRIGDLLDDTGWSRRRLAERFRQQTGLTAKSLARVMRFQHAVRILTGPGHRSLASIALTCGYYDQAHLNRDFRDLAGCTPTEYLGVRGADALAAAFCAVPS